MDNAKSDSTSKKKMVVIVIIMMMIRKDRQRWAYCSPFNKQEEGGGKIKEGKMRSQLRRGKAMPLWTASSMMEVRLHHSDTGAPGTSRSRRLDTLREQEHSSKRLTALKRVRKRRSQRARGDVLLRGCPREVSRLPFSK